MRGLELGLTFRRAGFSLDLDALIPASGITVLLGPSGSGKSTLLRAIAGLEKPDTGRISLDGTVWFDAARQVNLSPQQRRTGLQFQQYALFPHLTVAGNVGYGVPRAQRAERVARWLQALRIEDLATRYPAHISGGQAQRVALARALAAEPPVLLLDEPFSSVDAELRQHLRRLFRAAAGETGRPVLLVTHDLDDARELADRIGVLVAGRLRRFGAAAEVMHDPREVAVARTLGWHNLLPVCHVEAGRAHGHWGSVACEHAVAPCWIGIRSHELEPASDGLPARVTRVADRGTHTRVECVLAGDTPLVMDLPPGREPPAAGSRIFLKLRGAGAVALSEPSGDAPPPAAGAPSPVSSTSPSTCAKEPGHVRQIV